MKGLPTRVLVLTGLLVALLLAGVASHYASSRPDGLDRVAKDHGFADTRREHASDDGLFAGYGTKGVGDAQLSGGIAGVVGCVVVLTLVGGLTLVVRRRGSATAEDRRTTGHGGA